VRRQSRIHFNSDANCQSIYQREVDILTKRIAEGTAKDCFAIEFLKQVEKTGFDDTQKLFTLGSLLEAGSDTTRVTLGQIIAGAVTYPDWVIRAREQLDMVCGEAKRLPDFSDRDKLPLLTAVVKEGFRWRPNIAEIGTPTMLIKDDEYEGYKFPAGTIFTWNAWAIALDPNEYEQPERFWPERFLNDDLNNPLKGHWAFGPGTTSKLVLGDYIIYIPLGRRVCSGWNVGETNSWLAISRLLYCFDFTEVPVCYIPIHVIVYVTDFNRANP
jgi:cytochrome P450